MKQRYVSVVDINALVSSSKIPMCGILFCGLYFIDTEYSSGLIATSRSRRQGSNAVYSGRRQKYIHLLTFKKQAS